ncbi:MAG: pyridoxal phosphate-dependent aminotransferase [Alphaproteobacteria bacterium]|nr:pyridoxal phosphate-dependent aminotransferase [Alphaproteobacteria bacterium]MBU0796536.1 pyridoxal phosphate-dependent aminotransferase [Alphaproteobacteria bacterium]MBU0885686.1 pyridoxal phosphate-dependent aminotransferase [Alphaproteobacteria bacterium]MBU1811495.1 pyridoxal phosphate-dependent aminotransferase [Alphaproteobacteria bacterium]
MSLKIARRGQIPPFIVMDVLRAANERAAAGADVLHLEIGQPSTGAPQGVIAAAKRALDTDLLGYTDAFGIPALRQRLAEHYLDTYGVAVDPARVVATPGSSGGFILAFLAAFEPGDRVALAAPGYPAYRNILIALDIEPVEIPAGPETGYQPTPELLEKAREQGRIDGLIVASPANPTGTMLTPDALRDLAVYCHDEGIRLISDEIYHGIEYGPQAATALTYSDSAVVVNSFSKYFAMTGWRLGWLILPEDMLRPIECLAQSLFINASTLAQHAACAAFDCREELDLNVERYRRNRDIMLETLPAAGLTELSQADGAFYIYADVGCYTNDSAEFCRRLLAETGVAITPGLDFDPMRGNRFVRLSFAGDTEIIGEATARIGQFLR